MTDFNREEYLQALAKNGDKTAGREFEKDLDDRIFQLKFALAQTTDPLNRQELQTLLEQEENKKARYLKDKQDKALNSLKHAAAERERAEAYDEKRHKRNRIITFSVLAAIAAVLLGFLLWYSNNQNESETNPWKDGNISSASSSSSSVSETSSTSESISEESTASSVDTSQLTEEQLEKWVISTYASAMHSTPSHYEDWYVKSWIGSDGLAYAQLYNDDDESVFLFRVTTDGVLESDGGIASGVSGWQTASRTYSED
ncbi:hypothetical protein [Streptococcus dentiloxodontae]